MEEGHSFTLTMVMPLVLLKYQKGHTYSRLYCSSHKAYAKMQKCVPATSFLGLRKIPYFVKVAAAKPQH